MGEQVDTQQSDDAQAQDVLDVRGEDISTTFERVSAFKGEVAQLLEEFPGAQWLTSRG